MSKFFFQLKSLQKITPQQLNLLKTDLEWWINLLVPLSGRKIQTNNKNFKQFLKCIYHLLQEWTGMEWNGLVFLVLKMDERHCLFNSKHKLRQGAVKYFCSLCRKPFYPPIVHYASLTFEAPSDT